MRWWLSSLVSVGVATAVLGGVAGSAAAGVAVAPNGLGYSSASNAVIQRQPAANSCHALGRGLYSRPDPRCTPGTLNPAVTQGTISQTICRSGWAERVRPSESITEPEKYASMAAYGDLGSASGFEYDHLVPLELGGATNSPGNLWPEPGASPNRKDTVEDYLNREVCDRRMALSRAQKLIATDWVAAYRQITKRTAGATTSPAAHCSASAEWNSTHGDYDVYVDSNEPDTEAIVTGDGTTDSYYTNSSGYADVYFHAGETATGDRITVSVGPATCYARL